MTDNSKPDRFIVILTDGEVPLTKPPPLDFVVTPEGMTIRGVFYTNAQIDVLVQEWTWRP